MEHMKEKYGLLYEAYRESNSMNFGTPDQYQYRQNQLGQRVAELMLEPYIKWLDEKRGEKIKTLDSID